VGRALGHSTTVRGYGQYCPIARGAEVFATRWTPIIVRNLLLGCHTFGELKAGAPGIPGSVLTQRLRMLERYGVVERRPHPARRGSLYELTEAGRELESVTGALGAWGQRWMELAPEHFDAGMVLWGLCRLLPEDRLPDARTVIRFEVRDDPQKRYWLLLDPPEAEVCAKPPGGDEDGVVTTRAEWLAKWHTGRLSLGDALHAGVMEVEAPPGVERRLATWGGLGRL
jgi:DNA-binding HxlR family transcriptional regulator